MSSGMEDSEMRSSPEESESDLFPPTNATNNSHNDSITPTDNLSPVDKLKMGKLSPPHSQDPSGEDGAANTSSFVLPALEQYQGKDAKDEPGASWKNKKAQEDYNRAMTEVVDKDFNLKEFGDPYDDEELANFLAGSSRKNGSKNERR